MTSTPLDYASSHTPRPRRRWPWRVLWVVAGLLLAALAVPQVTVRRVESRIDPVTGSVRWKTVWPFGITSGRRVDVSPLETRLANSGIPWTPSWRFGHRTRYNLFGAAVCVECGSAPPVYQLRPVAQGFAAAATDAELLEFVRVLRTGTDAEQRAAVDAADEKGIQALFGVRRTGGRDAKRAFPDPPDR